MSNLTRIKKLEKQNKPTVKLTWREFIETTDVESLDADCKERGEITWTEFVKDEQKDKQNGNQN